MDGSLRPSASHPPTGLAGYGAIGRKNIAGDSENLFANAARLGAPRGTEVLEEGVGGVDTDYAEAGVLEVEDHIHGQGEGEHEKEDMEPAPTSGGGHLVTSEHGGNKRQGRQHDENNPGGMELGRRDPRGGDVDHGIEGRDQLDGGVSGAGFLRRSDGLDPDFGLHLLGTVVFGHGGPYVRQHRVGSDAGVEVLLEAGTQGVAIFRAEKVETQVGCPDMVGLLHDQVAALIETLGRAEEGETDEQPKQGEDGGVDDADKLFDRAPADFLVPSAHAVADFHGNQKGQSHAEEDREGEKAGNVGAEEGYRKHEWKV